MTIVERTEAALKAAIEKIDAKGETGYMAKVSKYQRDLYLATLGSIRMGLVTEEEIERTALVIYSLEIMAPGTGFTGLPVGLRAKFYVKAAVVIAASKKLA